MKKFGIVLISRQAGKEARSVMSNFFKNIEETEKIEIDFSGVQVFSPAWGDEFLSSLIKNHLNKLVFLNTENLSVQATLELLKKIYKIK